MLKIMENHIKVDDLGGGSHIFGNIHILRIRDFPYNPMTWGMGLEPEKSSSIGKVPIYWLVNRDPYAMVYEIISI